MKKTIQALVLLALSLLYSANGQSSEEKAQALFEQATNRVACMETASSNFKKAICAADILERAERIVSRYPDTCISKQLASGELKLGSSTLDLFRSTVFPELAERAGAGNDPLVDACMTIDPERSNGYYSPLECVPYFLNRGETNRALDILEVGRKQICEFEVPRGGWTREYDYWFVDFMTIIELYVVLGDSNQAVEIHSSFVDIKKNTFPYSFIFLGQPDIAKSVLDRLFEEEMSSEMPDQEWPVVYRIPDYAKDYLEIGITNKAIEWLDLAVTLLEKSKKPYLHIASEYQKHGELSEIAFLYCDLLETNKAVNALDIAVKQIPELGRADSKVYQLVSVAEAYERANKSVRALDTLVEAQRYAKEWRHIDVTLAVADKYTDLKQPEMTRQILKSLQTRIMVRVRKHQYRTHDLVRLARSYIYADMNHEAVETLDLALIAAKKVSTKKDKLRLFLDIAEEYANCNQPDKIVEVVKEILPVAYGSDDSELTYRYYLDSAGLYVKAGEIDKAVVLLEQVFQFSKSRGDPEDRAKLLTGLAKTYAQAGFTDKAQDLLAEAHEAIKTEKNTWIKRRMLFLISELMLTPKGDRPAEIEGKTNLFRRI